MQNWSIAQKQRLVELNADKSITEREFESLKERDAAFKQLERDLVKENKEKLKNLMEREHIPLDPAGGTGAGEMADGKRGLYTGRDSDYYRRRQTDENEYRAG